MTLQGWGPKIDNPLGEIRSKLPDRETLWADIHSKLTHAVIYGRFLRGIGSAFAPKSQIFDGMWSFNRNSDSEYFFIDWWSVSQYVDL